MTTEKAGDGDPLIRVTGLIIAVVAMQMMITGIRTGLKL